MFTVIIPFCETTLAWCFTVCVRASEDADLRYTNEYGGVELHEELEDIFKANDVPEELESSVLKGVPIVTLNVTKSLSGDSVISDKVMFMLVPSEKTNLLNSLTLPLPGRGSYGEDKPS